MGRATLDGVSFRIDPDSVRWAFRMKVADTKTVGGKVIQILGTDLGDMSLTGVFGNGSRAKNDTAGWEEQLRFAQFVRSLSKRVESGGGPVRFLYPPRRWDFHVYVKRLDQEPFEVANYNPRWSLTLFIVQDGTGTVVRGIRDLYIKRLMAGIGWKQTAYNGPMAQADVDKVTGGNTSAYIQGQIQGVVTGEGG
jgi:hypothetical protein